MFAVTKNAQTGKRIWSANAHSDSASVMLIVVA